MIIKNIKIVTLNEVIENGYIEVKDGLISNISSGKYIGNEETIDGLGSKKDYYVIVNLDLENQLFSITPYDGSLFKEVK